MADYDYSEGKIYLIKFRNDPSLVYVGSTKQLLNERFRFHKIDKGMSSYKYIHENCDGNWNDWYIELYEDYPCLNRKELEKREGEITLKFKNDSNYKCINERIAGRTKKEYQKIYYENNHEKILEKQKVYCEENKEKRNEIQKIYYESNREKLLQKYKKYYENNHEKKSENRKEKITCECGCIINKSSKARHLKSKKHDIQIHKTITNNT
jgi:hypothetical protein